MLSNYQYGVASYYMSQQPRTPRNNARTRAKLQAQWGALARVPGNKAPIVLAPPSRYNQVARNLAARGQRLRGYVAAPMRRRRQTPRPRPSRMPRIFE